MCPLDLPVAVVPLWQVVQVPGTTPAWLKLAPSQVVVEWQVSQESEVTMCPLGLPVAVVPLWQVVQVPGTTPVWLKLAGDHAGVPGTCAPCHNGTTATGKPSGHIV